MVMKSEAHICAIICLCLVLSRVTSLPRQEDSDTNNDIDTEIVGGVKLNKSSSIGGNGVLGAPIINPFQQPPSGNFRLVGLQADRFTLKKSPIIKDDVTQFLPDGYKPSQRTTANQGSEALLRELLNSLKEKDFDKLIPDRKDSKNSPIRQFSSESTTTRGFTKGVRIYDAVIVDDISKFLPPGYHGPIVQWINGTTTPEPYKLEINNLFKDAEIKPVDLPLPKVESEEIPLDLLPKGYPKDALKIEPAELPSSLLPKGYKLPKGYNIEQVELPSSLLPKGYNIEPEPLNPSLLPKGFNPDRAKGFNSDIINVEKVDLPYSLLSVDFKPQETEAEEQSLPFFYYIKPQEAPASLLPKGYKPGATPVSEPPRVESNTPKQIKLNFWPGSKNKAKPKAKGPASAPAPVIPEIKSFVRTTTEFTGWPTTTTKRTTTQSTTTKSTIPTTTYNYHNRPTTPVTCGDSCRLDATLRIVEGKEWSNYLLDPYTDGWQELAKMVTEELESLYLRSPLSDSFERVEVVAFSEGSIIVDYYVVFRELLQTVTTQDLKDTVEIETRQANNDNMLGPLRIDPRHSDFIVVSTEEAQPSTISKDEEPFRCPQLSACSTLRSPVCGTDGVTYTNLCRMWVTSCISQVTIISQHEGECRNNPSLEKPISAPPISSTKKPCRWVLDKSSMRYFTVCGDKR